MALPAAAHHSFDKVAAGEKYDGLRTQKTDRAREAANKALRRQKSKAAGEAVFFELFDEDTAGVRPEVLAEPRPQERVQRHTMEHIVDFVCCAPMVQILDAPVPQTVEQLQDVLQFIDRLTTVPEPVIEVPMILSEDVSMRTAASLLLQVMQRIAEQNVGIPVVGVSGAGGGLSGFLPGQHYSMTAEQIVVKVFAVDRVQQRFRSRSPSFPIQVEVFKISTNFMGHDMECGVFSLLRQEWCFLVCSSGLPSYPVAWSRLCGCRLSVLEAHGRISCSTLPCRRVVRTWKSGLRLRPCIFQSLVYGCCLWSYSVWIFRDSCAT